MRILLQVQFAYLIRLYLCDRPGHPKDRYYIPILTGGRREICTLQAPGFSVSHVYPILKKCYLFQGKLGICGVVVPGGSCALKVSGATGLQPPAGVSCRPCERLLHHHNQRITWYKASGHNSFRTKEINFWYPCIGSGLGNSWWETGVSLDRVY